LRSAAFRTRVSDLLASAEQLDKFTDESNKGLRFLLWLLSNLVEADS
jgi:hypothetical protein